LCNTPVLSTVTLDPLACVENAVSVAVANGMRDYSTYITSEENLFRASYISTCSAAKGNVNLYAPEQIYHYTLYYYDQADNLVRTVPPEGVAFLSNADIANVQTYRNAYAVADSLDTFSSYPVSQDSVAAFNNLSSTLSATGKTGNAIEMWTYNPNNTNDQVLATTPDQKYIFQTCISGNLLNVDIYKLTPTTPDTIKIASARHYHVDITSKLPLQPWLHTVMQDTSFMTGIPQIYVNGTNLPVVQDSVASGCGATVTAGTIPATMPKNWSTLKQLRFYTRYMTPQEIATNAANPYFLPSNQSSMTWYRFNVPPPGSATTIDDGNTTEFKYLPVYPAHRMATSYQYNATNQVNLQQSPDGGVNRYWYDLLSRLVVSQNDKQLPASNYSYTVFDAIGRITEVGQKNQNVINLGTPDYIDTTTNSSFLKAGTNTEITDTYYDLAAPTGNGIQSLTQNNLRKRVAATTYRDAASGAVTQATYYNYDIDGNVSNLYQQIDGLGTKEIDYEYDLVSGKVNLVAYQNGQPDQFYYNYVYDADNRVTEAWSSVNANITGYGFGSTLDPTVQRMDASYQYYLHGPLARVELGDVNAKVQGMDYAYTLQGWIKGVNNSDANPNTDIGGDGMALNPTVATDAMAYSLAYFSQDYQPIGPQGNPFIDVGRLVDANGAYNPSPYHSLYNGNITASATMVPALNVEQIFYNYQYDQLNRLTFRNSHQNNLPYNLNYTTELSEKFSYDGNGNISTLFRNSSYIEPSGSIQMDNQTFGYNLDASGNKINNQLNYVADTQPFWVSATDIDNQSPNNYTYDAIGNLIADQQTGINNINWTVYNKIKSIANNNGTNITYNYNTGNKRVSKTVNNVETWYVRDAQNNDLAVYNNSSGQIKWQEQDLYGSSRIGMWKPSVTLTVAGAAAAKWDTIGYKNYELDNHLGNVLATISDARIANGPDTLPPTNYNPTVTSGQYYYSFGMIEPHREINDQNYRYGFNGKENDNEVKLDDNGNANIGAQQDYGERIYDPRLGRFLSVDPLTDVYPELTPYQFASNNPIENIDVDGGEKESYLVHLLKSWLGIGPQPTNADEAIQRAGENQATQQVANYVNKLGDTYENIFGIVPGYAAGMEFAKGNNKTAGTYLVLDVFGEEIFGRIAKGVSYLPLNDATKAIGHLFESHINIPELFENAGVKSFAFKEGTNNSKTAIIGQGMEMVHKVAAGLKNAEVFEPSKEALKQWNKLLKDYTGKQIPDGIVKETAIFKENVKWINNVKEAGYDLIDAGGGNTSTFYNMEKETIYGRK